jgi:transcriptional regulator with XRE-family HTH domain
MARSLPPDPSLGAALRQLREARELSQEAVSHAANITLGAYGKIERNDVAPAWATVRAIANSGLGISMQELGEAVDQQG